MLRLQTQAVEDEEEKQIKNLLLSAIAFVHFLFWNLISPFLLELLYSQKKREENCLVYLRFLSVQNATIPITTATVITAINATSVVMNGGSVVTIGSVGYCSSGIIMPGPHVLVTPYIYDKI